MIIEGTGIEIPNSLIVDGDLNLYGTKITSLPECLSVGGWLYAEDAQLIASEAVQLEWIAKRDDMFSLFKAPTEKATRLHQMLWEL